MPPSINLIICSFLLGISVISYTQKSKDRSQKIPFAREKFKGYMYKAKHIWIGEDSQYAVDSFGDSLEQYASVTKMDQDGNPIGMSLINRQGEIMVPIIYEGIYGLC